MTPRPRIGITPWLRELPTALGERTRLYTLDPGYAAGVVRAGGIPLVVPHDVAPAVALDGLNGLLLSGGGDVAPTSYGAVDEGACEDVDDAADAWELAVVAEARTRRLPTLGICRGMQLLAVAHGGALAQSVADPGAHPGMGALPPTETLAKRHPVQIAAGSRAAAVFGSTELLVNTIHHQVVADPGGLVPTGWAPDGTIEALESPDWPALGVQWHPEKMPEPEQRRLFEDLVAAAARAAVAA
jgi:putative glutamine amidotransferase